MSKMRRNRKQRHRQAGLYPLMCATVARMVRSEFERNRQLKQRERESWPLPPPETKQVKVQSKMAVTERTEVHRLAQLWQPLGGTGGVPPQRFGAAKSKLSPEDLLRALADNPSLIPDEPGPLPRGWYQPFSKSALLRMADEVSLTRNGSHAVRLITSVVKAGYARPGLVGRALVEAAVKIEGLAPIFPNFRPVLDLVAERMMAAARSGKSLELPPILLHGPPGIGKTFFINALATALDVPVTRISLDTQTTGSTFLGQSRHWSDTEPGRITRAVAESRSANPVVLVDEIDKGTRFTGHGHPADSLHSILEPETAGRVTDICLEVEFDISGVFWFAAGNDLAQIPQSLVSRFQVFLILPPTGRTALQVARHAAARALERVGADLEPLDEELILAIAHLTPREVTQAVTHAAHKALAASRRKMHISDLPPGLVEVESKTPWLDTDDLDDLWSARLARPGDVLH